MMQVMGGATLIQHSTLRELRTAIEVYEKSEYTGGRERAAQFLVTVARDLLIGIGSFDQAPSINASVSVGGSVGTTDPIYINRAG